MPTWLHDTHIKIIERAGCRCERCDKQFLFEQLSPHHVIYCRHNLSSNDYRNGLSLCVTCHGWAHKNPVKALRMAGYIQIMRGDFKDIEEWYSWRREIRNKRIGIGDRK